METYGLLDGQRRGRFGYDGSTVDVDLGYGSLGTDILVMGLKMELVRLLEVLVQQTKLEHQILAPPVGFHVVAFMHRQLDKNILEQVRALRGEKLTYQGSCDRVKFADCFD